MRPAAATTRGAVNHDFNLMVPRCSLDPIFRDIGIRYSKGHQKSKPPHTSHPHLLHKCVHACVPIACPPLSPIALNDM